MGLLTADERRHCSVRRHHAAQLRDMPQQDVRQLPRATLHSAVFCGLQQRLTLSKQSGGDAASIVADTMARQHSGNRQAHPEQQECAIRMTRIGPRGLLACPRQEGTRELGSYQNSGAEHKGGDACRGTLTTRDHASDRAKEV